MSSIHDEFAAVLLARKAVSPEQLIDAWQLATRVGITLEEALIRLGYATAEAITEAHSVWAGLPMLDLDEVQIPPAIVELIPESVARENAVLPIAPEGKALLVAMAEVNLDILQKLEFILNRQIRPVLAVREQIVEAINRHYGASETESVDSMLAEFTDTAIDFTEVDTGSPTIRLTRIDSQDDAECEMDRSILSTASRAALEEKAPRLTQRRATVRYYHRMNPERMFPLLVILSRGQVEEIVRSGVRQAQSQTFQVEEGSLVEIEPILTGCACYPPRQQVRVASGEVSVTFWVVPQVLGRLMQARVVLRQGDETLAEVPIEATVVRQSVTRLVGALSLVLPFGLLLLKHFRLDFESQLQDGFGLYAALAGWLIRSLTPEVLGVLLLALTAGLYLWLRPRRREVFWDITTRKDDQAEPAPVTEPMSDNVDELCRQAESAFQRDDDREGERLLGKVLGRRPLHAPALSWLAKRRAQRGHHATALTLYEQVLAAGQCRAIDYFRASLAAFKAGETEKSLDILKRAESTLPPAEMKGPMWYNMGCFAARLGRFPEALAYLNRAVDAGFNDLEKFRNDPDLSVLQWHSGFRRLLAELAVP